MSECNIRLQGTIEKYKKSPTSLVYDYRVSSSAVRLYSVMLDFEYKKAFVSVELLAKKMLNKKGEPASTSKIKRLISELKQAGWLCVDEQRVYHKDTGAVRTIAEYVLFAKSASAPKSNKELLEEQAAEMAKEQAELETEYEGYQSSLGGEFDNLAAELEEQVKAGAIVIGTPPVQEEAQEAAGTIAPIPIAEDVQEQTLEVAEPSNLRDAIAYSEQRLWRKLSENQKQAIVKMLPHFANSREVEDFLNGFVNLELAKQG